MKKIAEWVGFSLRCGGRKDSESLAAPATQRALHRLTYWFSHVVETSVKVCKGSQICMITGMKGSKRYVKRKADEGEVGRKWQLRWWYGKQKERITYIPIRGDCLYRQLLW